MTEVHICKNCGNNFTGKFCNICGEKVYTARDKSIKYILGEGFHFLTHFEGTFFKTLKTVFIKPGKLSLDYCNGIRKKYFKPLSFFLMLVILYLLFPVFEGLNMKLYYHTKHNLYGRYATDEILSILRNRHITEEALADSFHHTGEKVSKFLLFIVIPFMAFFSFIAGSTKRKKFYDHFVFSIEAFSFFILWGFLLFPFILFLSRKVLGFPLFFDAQWQTGITILIVYIPYLSVACKRFFCFKWWYCILYSFLLTAFLLGFLEYIYKFILFLIAIRLA